MHVDAYRLGGIDELDDLDLDTSLEDAVTVVEWGEGIAEGLAESRLEIRIIRALAHQDEHADLDPRRVLMTPIGPRWYEMEVPEPAHRRWRRSSTRTSSSTSATAPSPISPPWTRRSRCGCR